MNRGGIEPSTEGACGEMYRQAAQFICDDQMNVKYLSGTEVSIKNITRHEVRVNEKEEEITSDQTRHKVQGRREGEVDTEAPVWWLLEAEGHSSNRRNRNRIRKHLWKKLDDLKRRTDLPDGVKREEMGKLEAQLSRYQRPPKPERQKLDWRRRKRKGEHHLKQRGKVLESAERATSRPGRRLGIPGSGVSYPVHRVMSRRRYGVTSDGDKFKGLTIHYELDERRRAREEERDAWHYHATMAELDVVEYQRAYTHLVAHQRGIGACAPKRRGILVGEVQESVDAVGLPSCEPPAPAIGVLFDFRQSSLCTAVHSAAGRAVESVHLDSGYYVYLPENIQLEADPVSDPCDGAVEKEDPQVEEGQGDEEIKITVRHGKKHSRCFLLCNLGRVMALQ